MTEPVTMFVCGPPRCEHQWDGPGIETETMSSATCSKCGVDAMTVSLWSDWDEAATPSESVDR